MASSRGELYAALKNAGSGGDETIDIADVALTLAALDHPEADLAPYREHLEDIKRRITRRVVSSDGVEKQAAALHDLLANHFHYIGDSETYDDVRNANLIDVIDRRRGLPVALGILYLHATRAYGGEIVGLNFPSHFLVRLSGRGQRVILDPFNRGSVMSAQSMREIIKTIHGKDAEVSADFYRPVSNQDVLIRLQNNIKTRAIASGDLRRAIDILGTMRLLAPERSDLTGEIAFLYCEIGENSAAIATLERFLTQEGASAGSPELELLLRRLRRHVH